MEENIEKQKEKQKSPKGLKAITIIVMVISFGLILVFVDDAVMNIIPSFSLKELFSVPIISEPGEFEAFSKDPNSSSAGVVVYGRGSRGYDFGGGSSYTWIENTNDFPVMVYVDFPSHKHPTKRTLYILQPKEVKKLSSLLEDTYFHIYEGREESKGRPIGFIVIPKPESKK